MEPEQALELRKAFQEVPFEDGDDTAGAYVKSIKNNRQITGKNEQGKNLLLQLSKMLFSNPAVRVFAFPKQMCRIMTNIHGEGEFYGRHIDNTMIGHPASGNSSRADMSYTIFLTDPADYDGGELSIEMNNTIVNAKGNPGEVVLYDSGLLHEVKPVTRGTRISTVGWIQSWISDPRMREAISELDLAIAELGNHSTVDRELKDKFHKVYNTVLRTHMQ